MQTVATVRVRYSETDAMGIVYHANYLVWFEVARTELFRILGIPYTRFEAEGLALAVVDASLRYKSPAKYDDLLELQAAVEKISHRKVVFKYAIRTQGNLLCEGQTTHIFVNRKGRATSAAGSTVWDEVCKTLKL